MPVFCRFVVTDLRELVFPSRPPEMQLPPSPTVSHPDETEPRSNPHSVSAAKLNGRYLPDESISVLLPNRTCTQSYWSMFPVLNGAKLDMLIHNFFAASRKEKKRKTLWVKLPAFLLNHMTGKPVSGMSQHTT